MPSKKEIETALNITPLFYSAALDRNLWDEVLGRLVNVFDATAAQLIIGSYSGNPKAIATHFFGLPPDVQARWLAIENHMEIDPRTPKAVQLPNKVLREIDMITLDEWHASEMYQQVFRRAGIDYTLGYTCQLDEEDTRAVLGLFRPRKTFSGTDVERLGLYVPHFRQAVYLAGAVARQTDVIKALSTVFDRLRSPVLVTDRFGEVKYLNAAAKRLVDSSRSLSVSGGRLIANNADTTNALRSSVFRAATVGTTEKADVTERLVTVPEPNDRSPLLVAVSPLDKDLRHSGHLAQMLAALFVFDPEQRLETSPEVLQRLYGLTGAEADVTARFVAGESLRDIAARTGRSYETVRWHLKQVMSKVGVSQQTELLRVVQSAAAPPIRE